jgi:tetratricopeptide (TPR) repeat protein
MEPPRWHTLAMQGMRLRRAKQPARAIECLKQSIEITRQLPELADETRINLNYLADLYLQEGMLAEAEAAIRQTLEMRPEHSGREWDQAMDDYLILAKVLSKQGRHQEAVEAGEKGLALYRQFHGYFDPLVREVRQRVKELKQNRAQAKREDRRRSPVKQAG